MAPVNTGAINLATALQETHTCSRNCEYQHLFANVFTCQTSGQVHVCDQTCNQRVWYDSYSSICRLSKRVWPHAPEVLRDQNVDRCGIALEPAIFNTLNSHFTISMCLQLLMLTCAIDFICRKRSFGEDGGSAKRSRPQPVSSQMEAF